MSVEHVQSCDKEFVRILLLVSGQMPSVCPNEVQQSMER